MSMLPPEPSVDSFNTPEPVTTSTEPVVEETIGNQFLKNVDPKDRLVLEKYINDWDKGVNARFREIHAEYAPWKGIGADPETVKGALQIYQMLETEPEKVYNLLAEELGMSQQEAEPEEVEYAADPAFGDLPEEFVSRFSRLEQMLEQITEKVTSVEQDKIAQEQDRQLQGILDDLKNRHGEFDEDAVLMRMSKGMKPDAAVKDYQQWVEKLVAQRTRENRRPAPTVLGGAGAVPAGFDPAKASRADSKNLFAQMLESSKES